MPADTPQQPSSPSPARIRLVTRGDDAGSSIGANHAVVECLTNGILKNASLMIPGPAFDALVPMIKGVKGVALGLHVVLNSEWETVRWGPVLPPEKVPSLVEPDGTFTRKTKDLQDRNANVEEMVAEVRAQLDKARRAGLELSYIDEHMGVGWVCGLHERLLRLAEDEGLVAASGVGGLRRPEGVERTGDMLADFEARLKAAEPGGAYVIVNHPYAAAHARPDDMPAHEQEQREKDRQFWLDPRTAELCRRYGAEPVRYTDVLTR